MSRDSSHRNRKRDIPVTRSHVTQISKQDDVLVLGGGVAGCAASIALARKGRRVTMLEREPTPRHKVCGEFLSGEALEDLHALGIDVAYLGAVPINYVRLAYRFVDGSIDDETTTYTQHGTFRLVRNHHIHRRNREVECPVIRTRAQLSQFAD
jgi:flavin-dependent dehydrogenase